MQTTHDFVTVLLVAMHIVIAHAMFLRVAGNLKSLMITRQPAKKTTLVKLCALNWDKYLTQGYLL